jgi:hypothetical protein
MVAASIVKHLVVANNVCIQWSADQLKESLHDTALRRDPKFYIDGIALSHGFLMFRKDLAKRGITVIKIFQDDKCVPSYYDMKASRMSIEVKFTAYHTPHSVEHQIRSPSDLAERSVKNVTAKVITSVEGVVGEKNSLYFLKSAVKILDFKQRKQNNLEDEDIESDSDNDENDIIPTYVEYEEYKNDERLKAVIENVPGKNIIFTAEGIKNVLKVFDVVKLMVSEKNVSKINNKSAAITVETFILFSTNSKICYKMAWDT